MLAACGPRSFNKLSGPREKPAKTNPPLRPEARKAQVFGFTQHYVLNSALCQTQCRISSGKAASDDADLTFICRQAMLVYERWFGGRVIIFRFEVIITRVGRAQARYNFRQNQRRQAKPSYEFFKACVMYSRAASPSS